MSFISIYIDISDINHISFVRKRYMKLTDIFPIEFTFWTTIWYIFLFYLTAYIIFHIYIYMYDLEYTVDCNDHTFQCFNIKPRASTEELTDESNEEEDISFI